MYIYGYSWKIPRWTLNTNQSINIYGILPVLDLTQSVGMHRGSNFKIQEYILYLS